MTYVIRIISLADGSPSDFDGMYLKSFDAEAHRGRGHVVATPNKSDAKRYPSHTAAWAEWRRQSKTVPLRADKRPNRPMTGYHVEIIPAQ